MTHWSIRKTQRRQEQVARLGRATGLGGDFSAVIDYALSSAISNQLQEVQEMIERAVDVVVINDIDAAIGIIRDADEQGVFDDNGGDPDGPAWIIEAGELGAALKPVVEQGVGHNARGVRVEGYNGSDQHRAWMDAHFQYWCGFSSRGIAYGIR